MSDPNAGVIQILRRTLPWVRLLSFVGFISVGCFGLLGAVSWVGLSSVGRVPIEALVVYPVLMVLSFVPSFYLHKCARRISTFVAQGHTAQLEAVLEAQRSFWKFLGALVLVIAGAMAVTLVAAMVIGLLAAVDRRSDHVLIEQGSDPEGGCRWIAVSSCV